MPTNIHTPKPPNTATPPDRLLRWSDVQPIVGICRSHAHQLAAKGLFPQPRKLVPGAELPPGSKVRSWNG